MKIKNLAKPYVTKHLAENPITDIIPVTSQDGKTIFYK